MRRIAIFSDIHANSIALDAVLADIDTSGVTERYCLGDLVGYGPDPQGVIARLRDAGIPTIPGNYDEGVASRRGECGCYYATDAARADGAESYSFTDARLSQADAEWLLSLPAQIRLQEDDARILLTHGSPRKINEYLMLDRTEEQLGRLALAADADVVCHGHVHIAYHRSFDAPSPQAPSSDAPSPQTSPSDSMPPRRIHYVSSGSVGKPKDGDPRAGWVELVFGQEGHVRAAAPGDEAIAPVGETDVWLGAIFHRVDYDIEGTIAGMEAEGLPARLASSLRTGA